MPIGSTHRKQSAKNWLLLGILVVLVGAIYGITVLRVSHATGTTMQDVTHP